MIGIFWSAPPWTEEGEENKRGEEGQGDKTKESSMTTTMFITKKQKKMKNALCHIVTEE